MDVSRQSPGLLTRRQARAIAMELHAQEYEPETHGRNTEELEYAKRGRGREQGRHRTDKSYGGPYGTKDRCPAVKNTPEHRYAPEQVAKGANGEARNRLDGEGVVPVGRRCHERGPGSIGCRARRVTELNSLTLVKPGTAISSRDRRRLPVEALFPLLP